MKNLRALGALYPETVQLVVRANAGVKTFNDLKGKSISSGSPGSGQWQLLGDLLIAHGMDSKNDVSEDYSSFSQSVEKIKDGNLDASLITAGTPTASVVELANHHDIMIVPLSGDPIKALQKVQPFFYSLGVKYPSDRCVTRLRGIGFIKSGKFFPPTVQDCRQERMSRVRSGGKKRRSVYSAHDPRCRTLGGAYR